MSFLTLVRENRWTALMLTSVVVLYSLLIFMGHVSKDTHAPKVEKKEAISMEELREKEDIVKQRLEGSPVLAGALSLGFVALFIGGVLLDIFLLRQRSKGKSWVRGAPRVPIVQWGKKEILQAVVFIFFAEGCLFLIQVTGLWATGADVSEDVLLMTSSLLRDLAAAAFVFILVKRLGGRPLERLGIVRVGFFRNVRLGIVSYIAVVPVLVLSLVVMAGVSSLFSYEPAPQNVVGMYLKTDSAPTLIVFTIFVALIGPVLEEIFFRGFAYSGLRRSLGSWKASFLTAAVFAGFHLSIFAFIPIFILGIFLSTLYESTGSLVPSISAHVLHNALMISLTLGFRTLSS